MQTFADITQLREALSSARAQSKSIAFVPTMGNLHEGHLTLVRKAQEHADIVVVSIFVNPMQFNQAEDLENYPRTLEQDLEKLTKEGVEIVFTPTPEIMYPEGMETHTFVEVPGLSHRLEGQSRPGHFRGVSTVVTKLFNIVQPNVACFGEKDFQQLAVIRKMVSDLAMNIQIIGVPTVRELDGLAMSSRNGRLSLSQRQRAPVLARTMRWISSQIRNGRHDFDDLIEDASDQLRAAGLQPDEIYLCDANTLELANAETQNIVILMSALLGGVRLIDNQVVEKTTPSQSENAQSDNPDV